MASRSSRSSETQPDAHPSRGRLTYPNEVTHWWDASQLYRQHPADGGSPAHGADGRLVDEGKLHLPENLCADQSGHGRRGYRFHTELVAGSLSLSHAVCAAPQSHLRRADACVPDTPLDRAINSSSTARLINAAVMAKIHTVEWTPAVLPNNKVAPGLCVNWWGLSETRLRPFRKRRIQRTLKLRHPVLGGLVGGRRDNHGVRHQFAEEFVSAYRLHEGLTEKIEIRYVEDTSARTFVATDATRGHAAHRLVHAHGLGNLFN